MVIQNKSVVLNFLFYYIIIGQSIEAWYMFCIFKMFHKPYWILFCTKHLCVNNKLNKVQSLMPGPRVGLCSIRIWRDPLSSFITRDSELGGLLLMLGS